MNEYLVKYDPLRVLLSSSYKTVRWWKIVVQAL